MGELLKKPDGFLDKVCAPKFRVLRNVICLLICVLSIFSIISLMYIPICATLGGEYDLTAANVFESMASSDTAVYGFFFVQFVAFVVILACILIGAVMTLKTLFQFSNDEKIAQCTRKTVVFSAVVVVIYTFFTFAFSPINRALGGISWLHMSYFPVVLICLTGLLYALLVGTLVTHRRNKAIETVTAAQKLEIDMKKHRRKLFLYQLEAMLFSVAVTATALIALLSKIVTVRFDKTAVEIPDMVISGLEVLTGKSELMSKGERLMGFFVFAAIFLTASMFFLALTAFISRSQQCNKIITSSVIVSSVSCVTAGLFGQYYKMIQELNVEVVEQLLKEYSIPLDELLIYDIESNTIRFCFVIVGVLMLFIIRRPLTKAGDEYRELSRYDALLAPCAEVTVESANIAINNDNPNEIESGAEDEETDQEPELNTEEQDDSLDEIEDEVEEQPIKKDDFDPCPAFTELDNKIEEYAMTLSERRNNLMEDPTLPNLVNYIVEYARDSKHHLFYTSESIATFLAGLGSTRLTILQGMSGTGKTSLPKIVSEALMSVCDIIEVESSWRDKNELLGYYNEFNKIYTPRKFTQALYRACLNTDTITFIVLDEMNLSRIEYYFSDFLSLMENEPDKRMLQLLNTPIARIEDGEKKCYTALLDCHTVKIPENVWFIGTANRDESTYDISDKVYDRAHTMNFDKRAKKPEFFGTPMQAKYLPAKELMRLFDEARETVHTNIDDYPVVRKAEELLEPYNISFGNRIAMQIENFVNIYVSCFTNNSETVNDALDIIMLSKVVKKLELKSVDDKDDLSREFEKIGLNRCARFIMSLKEE